MEDEKIIKLYFERDETALTKTAEKYGSFCYTIAFNVLGNEEDSKETVNDTVAKKLHTEHSRKNI